MRTRSATAAPVRRSKPARPTADFRSIVENLATPVILADRRGNVTYSNPAAQACFGDSRRIESLLESVVFPPPSENWTTLLHRGLGEVGGIRLACVRRSRHSGANAEGTIHILKLDRPSRRRSSAAPPPTETAVITFTEEKRRDADEPNEVSHRLLSLGKLAARVAHELNNPLDGIIRYINLALRLADESSDPKLQNYLFESRTGLLRMVRIIGDLLEYSRTAGESDEVGVNEIVEQAIAAVAAAADDRRIVVAVDFQHRDMPAIRGTRLFQVLVNLLRNAIDAMPGGGRLTITSGLIENHVVLRVADTGPGLPLPIERLFEPFFTTKAPGRGTGLGLAICKEFVEGMGGTIRAENLPTGGAVLTVRMPAPSEPGAQAMGRSTPTEARS